MHTTARTFGYKKHDLARHSLFFMLLLPCFFSAETASIALLGIFFIWLAISRFRLDKGLFSLILPFLVLLAIGSVGIARYPAMDVVKDVWYVGKVVVAIGSGFVLARFLPREFSKVLRVIVFAGGFAAVVHLVEVAIHWESGKSFFDLRGGEGIRGYFVTVIGAAVLASVSRKNLHISKFPYFLVIAVSLLSISVAFSRTYIVIFLIMVVILKGWAKVKITSFTKVASAVGLAVLGVLLLSNSDNAEEKNIADKFVNSIDEILIQDYSEMRDINQHWRGFESYRAMKDYQESHIFEKIFGQGLGAKIDLGFYMQLGGNEFRYIPVLHNGYMYVLVKFGLAGLIFYLMFLLKLVMTISYIKNSKEFGNNELNISRMIAAVGWALMLTTFVISGAFNKSTMLPALIILGLCVGLIRNHREFRTA